MAPPSAASALLLLLASAASAPSSHASALIPPLRRRDSRRGGGTAPPSAEVALPPLPASPTTTPGARSRPRRQRGRRRPARGGSGAGDGSPRPEDCDPAAAEVANPIAPAASARLLAVRALSSSPKMDGGGDGTAFAARRLESDPLYLSHPDARERSFARCLVASVQRRCGQIDAVLGGCADVYPPKGGRHAGTVAACLRVGAAQLLFLGTPGYAAVKETVDALKHRSSSSRPAPASMVRFANAVLRRVQREGPALLERTGPRDNVAPWLVREWERAWGADATEKICERMMAEPRVDLTVGLSSPYLDGEGRAAELECLRRQFGEDAVVLPQGSIRVGADVSGAISDWPGYHGGTWWVQDVSSTLPALALHGALREWGDITEMRVADVCAAPGGKTAQLLSLGFGHVTAVEADARRCRRLRENLDRLGFPDGGGRCQVVVSRGQDWLPPRVGGVAGVLLDAPCSATGTGARRPDVLRRSPDLGNLPETQEQLASHVADNVLAVGGVMVYATCSLLREEGEDQICKLLARGEAGDVETPVEDGGGRPARMVTLPFLPGEIPGFDESIDRNGWLRVLPGTLGGELAECDGFFVARLVRAG